MASDDESLKSLEALMNEFFSAATTNSRKREIEEILNNFGQIRDAWRHCLYYMSCTANEYVLMYCMTVLEGLINRRWVGLSTHHKTEIRATLTQYLLSHHDQIPTYLRNKLAKLVVDIGRIDWPHFYPDFFSSILHLVQQPDTSMLGIILLQTASEELATPREDLSMSRKEELQRLLLTQVPSVLVLLNNILDSVLEKHQHLVAATPPPSPTHSNHEMTGTTPPKHQRSQMFSSSPMPSGKLLSNMFKSPGFRVQFEALPPLDNESQTLCVLALNCISHYFSWIPLSNTITPSLLSTIFHFAAFGCELKQPVNNRLTTNLTNNFSSNTQLLGVLAMNCINELLAKNCVPQEFENFLLQMFQQTFDLLQRLTRETGSIASENRLSELDENYIEKFTEFLGLFVSIHLRRFESSPNFPVLELLALMFKYTFKQPTHEGFYNCLDIWITFLDYLHTKLKTRNTDIESLLTKYRDALMSLITQIMQKCQFRYNQTHLEELDDETLDDDSETEWQHFLRQCLEVIAKVADLITVETFRLLHQPFDENLIIYLGLDQYLSNGPQSRRLMITSEHECRRLHCALRDLSGLLQSLGRLADHFIGENFVKRFTDARVFVERLINAVSYGTRCKLYDISSPAQTVIQSDFTEVHAQALAAVKAFSHWLAQFHSETSKEGIQEDECRRLITSIMEALVPLFGKQVPEKIVHSASHLLVSIVMTVRPPFLLEIPCVQELYSNASQGKCGHLSSEVQLLLYRALSHYLLLPWPNLTEPDQDWEKRSCHHRAFVQQMTTSYLRVKDIPRLSQDKDVQETAKPVIKCHLHMLTDWVHTIAGEAQKSKQICFQSLQEVIDLTLQLFRIFIQKSDVVDDVLGFFLALFQGLRIQMGVPLTQQIIQTFMTLFTREQLSEIMLQEGNTGTKVMERFLCIIEVIVQEHGSSFKTFLPSIVSICMDQIYPVIAQRQSPDIKLPLYSVLHELLLNNWRYFFMPAITNSSQCSLDDSIHQQQFVMIMQAFGQSFLQPDISIFRHNLEALENLNSKCKLYTKKIFKDLMRFQFLNVLIQVLIHKSHDLLQEEIGYMVYNMAGADLESFHGRFLPEFLRACENIDVNQIRVLIDNFKSEKDLPSFTQNLHRFVNDLRYYQLVNSSLPTGAVTF